MLNDKTEPFSMIKKNMFRLFFLLCSVVIIIHLLKLTPQQILSLNTLAQLGFLLISLELTINLKIKNSTHHTEKDAENIEISSNAHLTPQKDYPFHWSKIGLGTVSLAYLTQMLIV